jgi:hypothetical protein
MADLTERTASLEAHRTWYWKALSCLAVLGFGWLTWASLAIISIKGDMQAIKQKIKDGGLGDIVSELKEPKSNQQLQANLSTVTAQIQTARINGEHPDEKKVEALSGALSQVVRHNPDLPEVWRAASELISYRSLNVPLDQRTGVSDVNLPNCTDSAPNPMRVTEVGPGGTIKKISSPYYENCKLTLDSAVDDDRINFLVRKGFPGIEFRHCLIVYKGGNFMLITFVKLNDVQLAGGHGRGASMSYSGPSMIFTQCKFDFSISNQISAGAQEFLEALLVQPGPSLHFPG